ncbi:hypothetical protein LX87_05193 [Larkinella arboricola]|uniref:Uncharacterized protein n=1 Tax=Larkinella arboricola TaxID=643671 RepID=A0A327WLR9_LARAB|nr:hypothetical protein [Larkinella arboricola]RAJ92225.1 hypothetical protein LX87_05193 [Larkinella arboricola]
MADSLNLTKLADSLEEYARENYDNIYGRAMIPGVDQGVDGSAIVPIDDYMTSIQTSDEVVLSELEIGDVAQPGGKDSFNPTENAVTPSARIGKVRQVKVDVLFSHTKIMALYKSWLGKVKAKRINPEEVPLEEYITAGILAKYRENIRVKTLFNGVYNKAGNTPLDVMDGLRTQILAEITSGGIPSANIIDTAVITVDNAVAEFEKMLAAIPDAELYGDMVCVTSRQLKTFYELNFRKLYGTLPYNTGQEKAVIVGSNIRFVVEPGLADFKRPLFTPKGNLVYLYDDMDGADTLATDYNKRERNLAWLMDAQVGAGIAQPNRIWTNDGV